jgi:CRP-like cAMP-binding protein
MGSKNNCEDCKSRGSSIFCELNDHELSEVSKHKTTNKYKKGQNLFLEGNPPFGLFCISNGKIKLTKTSDDGKETIIKIAKPGDVLGHRSLFSNQNYNASATAIEECEVCFLDKSYVDKAIKQNPSIAMQIIGKLTKDMGAFEDKMASFHQMNVREKFAHFIIDMDVEFGENTPQGRYLNLKLTREEMASMIGTATETLIRTVTEFKDEGAIELDGKKIYITNYDTLRELGNIELD